MGGGSEDSIPEAIPVPEGAYHAPSAPPLASEDLGEQGRHAASCGLYDVAVERYKDAADDLLHRAQFAVNASERIALELQAQEYTDLASRIAREHNIQPNLLNNHVIHDQQQQRRHGDDFSPEQIRSGASVMGVGLGGVLGSMLGLPIIGGIVGFLVAGYYVDDDSENGAKARNLGTVGARVIRTSQELDSKYDVTGKAKNALSTAKDKVLEIEEKHNVSGKVKEASWAALMKARQINNDYHVSERISKAFQDALDRLSASSNESNSNNNRRERE